MRAGAEDFVQKPYTAQRILEAVAGAQRSGADGARAAALVAGLTPRERQVLAKLVEGKGNKAVAADLDLSVRTVETYRAAIMDKLRVKSLPEMVRIALAAGLDPVKPEAVD
jgi:FixJ family two-component response regulator